MKEELLGVMVRARGDAKVKIEGLDLDAQGRRVRISIVKPVAVEDEVSRATTTGSLKVALGFDFQNSTS